MFRVFTALFIQAYIISKKRYLWSNCMDIHARGGRKWLSVKSSQVMKTIKSSHEAHQAKSQNLSSHSQGKSWLMTWLEWFDMVSHFLPTLIQAPLKTNRNSSHQFPALTIIICLWIFYLCSYTTDIIQSGNYTISLFVYYLSLFSHHIFIEYILKIF